MPRIPHVTRRDGRYVFRRRIHFRNLISKPLAIALRTSVPDIARQRAAALSAHFMLLKLRVREMLESGRELTKAEIETLFRDSLEERLRQHVRIAFEHSEWSDQALRIAADDLVAYLTLRPTGELDPGLVEVVKEVLPDEDIVQTLASIGAPTDPSNVAMARTHIFRARAAAGKRVQRLYDEDIMDAPDVVMALMADIAPSAQSHLPLPISQGTLAQNASLGRQPECQFLIYDSRRFGDIIEDTLRELKAERVWKGDISQQRRVLQTFAWITGNRELGTYDHRDVKAFKDGLLRLPKKFRFGTLTEGAMAQPFDEAVSKLPPIGPGEARKMQTVNRDLSYMSTVSKHLAESAWKPRQHDTLVLNFAGALAGIVNDGIDPRPPWSTKHMECLFASPIYTGGGGELRRLHEAPSPRVFHDAAYFAPLLWYYTHACREEICGLEVADVVIDHPTPHIRIRDNLTRGRDGEKAGEKRLARRRQIPLHSEIIRLGLLDYVSTIRNEGHLAVFPELYLNEKKRGGAHFYERAWVHMVEWIADRMPLPCNEFGKGPDIHSIRSLGSSHYEINGVNELMRADLMGHARQDTNGKHYSKRQKTEGIDVVLAERLEFLETYVPVITGDILASPIRLLPIERRSRVGTSRTRKPRTKPRKPSTKAQK